MNREEKSKFAHALEDAGASYDHAKKLEQLVHRVAIMWRLHLWFLFCSGLGLGYLVKTMIDQFKDR